MKIFKLTTIREISARLGLAKALIPAVSAKFITALTNWVFLPLAAINLGPERYGAYALFISLLSLLNIVDSGMGSGIVRVVAKSTTHDHNFMWSVFKKGTNFYSRIAAILVVVSCVIINWGNRESLGRVEIAYLTVATLIVGAQVAISPVARVYAGGGMIHEWNRLSVLANLLLLCVTIAAGFSQTRIALLVLIIGHAISILFLPCLAAFSLKRKSQATATSHECPNIAPILLREASMQLPVIVSGVLQRELPKWGVLIPFGASDLGRLSLLLTVLTGVGGLVAMFTSVIWPKMATSYTCGDYNWTKKLRLFLYGIYLVFLILLTGVALLANWHFAGRITLGGFEYSNRAIFFWVLFSGLILWEHIHYVMLMAIDKLNVVAYVSIAQSLICLSIWLFSNTESSLDRYLEAQVIALTLCSAWAFPLYVNSQLQRNE